MTHRRTPALIGRSKALAMHDRHPESTLQAIASIDA
uniref:Uncharacterized protein n=1 Tax=Arundo donax TaxID=35708 RepID=A0A0A9BR97_ARUDO